MASGYTLQCIGNYSPSGGWNPSCGFEVETASGFYFYYKENGEIQAFEHHFKQLKDYPPLAGCCAYSWCPKCNKVHNVITSLYDKPERSLYGKRSYITPLCPDCGSRVYSGIEEGIFIERDERYDEADLRCPKCGGRILSSTSWIV